MRIRTMPAARAAATAALLALALPWSGAARAADREVVIEEVASAEGAIFVSLHDGEASWSGTPSATQKVAPQPGRTRVVFGGLAPGDYAVRVFHDRNGNGALDTNMVGIPREPYGFSGKGAGRFGPPPWADARVELPAQGAQAVVRLTR